MVPLLFLIWDQGKLAWFRFCIQPTKSAMVPFLVPFRTGIMVPKVDQVFVHFLKELINSSCSRKTAKSLINSCGVYLCASSFFKPMHLFTVFGICLFALVWMGVFETAKFHFVHDINNRPRCAGVVRGAECGDGCGLCAGKILPAPVSDKIFMEISIFTQ